MIQSNVRRGSMAGVFVYVVVELLGMSLILPLLPYYACTFAASPMVFASRILDGLLGGNIALAQS